MEHNKIYNMDCIEGMERLLEEYGEGSIDMIVTSPPYWKGFEYEAYFNSYAQYLRWSEKWLALAKKLLKRDGNPVSECY